MSQRPTHRPAQIGLFCAIPFLISLLAYSAASFMISVLESSGFASYRVPDPAALETAALQEDNRRLRELLATARRRVDQMGPGAAAASQACDDLIAGETQVADLQTQIAQARQRQKRLQQLEAAIEEKRISGDLVQRTATSMADEVNRTGEEISRTTAELDRLRNEGKVAPDRIIGGLGRDALYMECTKDAARVMPIEVVLGPKAAPNEQARLIDLASVKGMVYFLIRPDGYDTFRTYRRVLESHLAVKKEAKIDMGYEPVDQDWKLTYVNLGKYYVIRRENDGQ